MEDSRNQSNNLNNQNKSNGSNGSEDQEKISPRSLENLKSINSNLLQLVDDITSPRNEDQNTNDQIKGMNIGVALNNQLQNAQGTDNIAGGTPFFPALVQENLEKMQNQVTGVGDFQNPMPGYPQNYIKGNISRHSSEGGIDNKISNPQNVHSQNRNEFSTMGMFDGPLSVNKFEDNYSNMSWIDSNSDYQEKVEKFGYIFQSPDLTVHRQQTHNNKQGGYQAPFQGFGQQFHAQTTQYPQWEGYHQNHLAKQPHQTFQNRASSFDKLAQQTIQQHPFSHNEELETHSAASSGNHSAFSEGDVYQQQQLHQQTPQQQQQYYAQSGYQGQYVNSNHAQYGFTPNVQFTNSNQKYYAPPFQQSLDQEELTPGSYNHADIQITDLDVNLQKFQIGVSPRRLSNEFKPQAKPINQGQLNYEQLDKSNTQAHHQYKTPSPFRNDPNIAGGYNHNLMINQNMNANKNVRPQNYHQYQDPFYPQNYGFQNQRMSHTGNYGMKPNYPMQRSSNIDQYTGNSHIGMNAPPMTRNLHFTPHEQHIIHGGPMIAIQQNMHQAYHPNINMSAMNMAYNVQQPLRTQTIAKQTGSQERDPSYQPPNFIPQQQVVVPKTVVNTPTHNTSLEHNKSVSSQNSTNSQQQQFSQVMTDSNEAFLFQLTKQYDDCPNLQQKYEIIKGHVHKLALTQKGSRFLQKQVTKANSGIVAFFLDEISPYLCDLMIDNYGNYFCQSLLSSCSGDQRLSILRSIKPKFIEICCDRKGTHTIQTMFELVNLPEEEDFIREALIGNVIRLSKDAQGTHVIQKVMASFPEHKRAFIYEEVFDQFIDLAKNTNGLCVVKKLVQFTKNSEQAQILMKKIQDNAIDLVQDPFGNYAVTEIIIKWDPEICKPIFDTLKSRISQLSSQKFSSNVVEKCLERADEQTRSTLIIELAYSERLTSLIRNQYGNYVVQKALKLAFGQDKETLIQQIQKCVPDITDKKIREKWEKIIYDAINGTNTASQQTVNDNTSTGSFTQDLEATNVPPGLQSIGVNSGSHRQITVGNRRANSSDNHPTAN